jgi:eukaryotic-like serine/threonine-protein kinase
MEPARPGGLIAGRYRLGAIIGRGGMGVVWQACDELLCRDVAVKELIWPAHFSEAEQQAACRRATREAQMAARLNHDNVIRVFDIVHDRECPWIVMEFLPCRSLRDVIEEEGPLSPVRAARAGLEILAALRAAHAAGIVHRDVKPANILMAPDRAVLTDFGIARAAGSALTIAGVLIGSPPYIAPERAMGGLSGPPGDLWGLGACLYAAVEGHGPFDRDAGALASLTAIVADEPQPATHAGPLWPVISGLLRKDPAQRLDAAQAERMLLTVAAPAASRRSAAATAAWRSRILAAGLVGLTALTALAASSTAAALVSTGPPSRVMVLTTAVSPQATRWVST